LRYAIEEPLMNTSLTWAKRWLTTILALLLVVGVGALCIALPPLVAFEPRPLLALALVALGGGAALWRGEGAIRVAVRLAGAAALWAIIFWCVLSQSIAFYQPIGVIAAQRALPVVLLTGVWACLALPRAWQQGAAAAVTAPTLLALTFIGWVDLPRTANFLPNYLVVDSHHTLYVADRDMGAIRVFGPDGGLRAKLWPGLASHLGPPGPGFSPAGPYSDPDHLGIQAVLRASGAAPPALCARPQSRRDAALRPRWPPPGALGFAG
jgi:hypothetical protein